MNKLLQTKIPALTSTIEKVLECLLNDKLTILMAKFPEFKQVICCSISYRQTSLITISNFNTVEVLEYSLVFKRHFEGNYLN